MRISDWSSDVCSSDLIDGPHGNFWLREGKGPILCIAGGSGLAPLLSLLQDAANRRVRRDCILLFGGRGERDLYAADAISAIRSGWTASFDYWPVLSEETHPNYRQGDRKSTRLNSSH